MKKIFLCMMLFCGLAMISTSCQTDDTVPAEVENGSMIINDQTIKVHSAKDVSLGDQNAIVFTAKQMTDADNEGIAIVFNGNITPGTYKAGDDKGETPRIIGLKDFNMGELPFAVGNDTIYYGDVYVWVSGSLSITEEDGTYTVILSNCVATNNSNVSINLSVNYSGILEPYVYDTENKFTINNVTSPIGLAGITSLGGMDTIGHYYGVRSMLFMSADRQRFFIVSYLGGSTADGNYNLGYLITPYLPTFPCVHVALDADFWTFQPQTGYVAKSGKLNVSTNPDGTKTVTMENLVLTNVEHPNSAFFPDIPASLQYHGYMYEIGQ
ncbi:MAG: hypothetical protein K6A28_03700 [Bacteroidales bacterium]|nr:hypothetical protein [Bacteroidales bacterium]